MQSINTLPTRAYVSAHSFIARRTNSEFGGVTAEYGTLALISVALVISVAGIISGGLIDGALQSMLESVLKKATKTAGGI